MKLLRGYLNKSLGFQKGSVFFYFENGGGRQNAKLETTAIFRVYGYLDFPYKFGI